MSNKLKWYKLPPVPGWYVVAWISKKEVIQMGARMFSEWGIFDVVEMKNYYYYGPLPIEEIEYDEE